MVEQESAELDCFIVVPCYRESSRIGDPMKALCEAIAMTKYSVSIVFVDDGSGNEERVLLEKRIAELRDTYPFVRDMLALKENRGKGGAIRAGWSLAPLNCRCLAFLDADGATSPRSFLDVLERAIATKGLAIGSRRLIESRSKRYWYRSLASRLFSNLVRVRYGFKILDTQCGCKVLPAYFFWDIEPVLKQERFGLDIEILRHAAERGVEVIEIPVDWTEVAESRLRLSTVVSLFIDVLLKRI